jgi:hypothetical protein
MGARGPPSILPSNAPPKSSAAASVSRELEDCRSSGLQHRFCAVAVGDVVDRRGRARLRLRRPNSSATPRTSRHGRRGAQSHWLRSAARKGSGSAAFLMRCWPLHGIAGETGGRRSMQAQRPSRSDMPPASSMAMIVAPITVTCSEDQGERCLRRSRPTTRVTEDEPKVVFVELDEQVVDVVVEYSDASSK